MNKSIDDEILRLIGDGKIRSFDLPRFHTASFISSAKLKADACAFPYRLHLSVVMRRLLSDE
jgi:hypothetical protein